MPECSCGLLIDGKGKVLLGLRSATKKIYPSVWDAFGGHIEPGESTEQALIRELQEELAVTPTAFTFLTTIPEPDPGKNGERAYHAFGVRSWTGPGPRLNNDEHEEMRWCSLSEALALDLALPAYRDILPTLIS